MAVPPPTTAATEPDVVDNAFADTRDAASVVCGSPADSAARTKRFTEKTASPAA